MRQHSFKHILCGVVMVAATTAAFTGVVWALWECIMHHALGLPILTYWQSLGLLVLSRVLFGGLGGFGHRGFGRHCGGFGHGGWEHRRQLREKWLNMSEDERAAFVKEKASHRFGFGCCGSERGDRERTGDRGNERKVEEE
ncbi:hypothetical protein AGMMS49938_07200 [Fibrobacterales bacterium]|nr:hypothetical protein AGMMS49938_07200 [Fibrobacterales bacterium]